MASTNVKRIVGDTLATYISNAVPALNGNVKAVPSGPEENLTVPAVRLIFQAASFEPTNYDEVYYNDPDDGKVVIEVGYFRGPLIIELWANTKPERETLEQAILDVFMADPWSPGVIITETPALTINGYVSLHTSEIKARLDQEDWRDEMAFEGHRYTFLTLDVEWSALTTMNAVTLTKLNIDFSSDFEAVITDASQLDKTDKAEIQDDGTTIQADP